MRMKRRNFIKTSLTAGAALAVPDFFTGLATAQAESPVLPWQREMPLRDAAKSVTLENTLNGTNPYPGFDDYPGVGEAGHGAAAMAINNLKMRTAIWGPPERITISLTKNNVWDRRLHYFEAPTLKEISEGAFAPINADYVGIDPARTGHSGANGESSLRPKDYGWLWKEGGSHDPYREPMRYAFPSMKPVGQMILGIDALAGADAAQLSQSCANGVTALQVTKGGAKIDLKYVLGMKSNIYAVRGAFTGIDTPIWFRLYRHQDTSHLLYMKADGKTYTNPAAEADKAFNGPIDPPSSGRDGKYFWIRQRMPAEKTFPEGFEYVLMGVVSAQGEATLEAVEGKTGLGTPHPSAHMIGDIPNGGTPSIANAPGAAATAILARAGDGNLEALVTLVTTIDVANGDGSDLLALAKQRLADAEAEGFETVVKENTGWWTDFYNRRENGRIFHGATGTNCTDDIRAIYRSVANIHGGGTKTDMRQLECSAPYALPERDFQQWDSSPCYNDPIWPHTFVHNWGDSEEMWKQIVWHWMDAAKENARHICDLPGMMITHGYLPPVKPDKYVHTTITLEFCLDTMAQLIRPAWDEWDYGGDIRVLREECYPLMKEMAQFYAAYAKKGDDGYYHVIPCMQPEVWGFYPKFARNKDVISSLCMFRWALTRAAEGAEVLGVDEDLRTHWREVAAQMVPYPTWKRQEGLVFAEMPDLEPKRLPDDHFGDAAAYPALMADEINLDSPEELKEMMIRGVRMLPSAHTNPTLIILGVAPPSPDRESDGMLDNDVEKLLNSRSGRIHLFPVSEWDPPLVDAYSKKNEVAFRNFQARGGFLVSACKNTDGVYYVEIEARRNISCQLMNPWPGQLVVVREVGKKEPVPTHLDTSNGECVMFSALSGHRYQISRSAWLLRPS
jgi:hypothetical protein